MNTSKGNASHRRQVAIIATNTTIASSVGSDFKFLSSPIAGLRDPF